MEEEASFVGPLAELLPHAPSYARVVHVQLFSHDTLVMAFLRSRIETLDKRKSFHLMWSLHRFVINCFGTKS